MTFTEKLWQSTLPIYDAILAHPFNAELASGLLELDKFKYYIQQDELYIKAYARALALLAAKAPDSDIANDLLTYTKDGVMVEQILHDHFFQQFNIQSTQQQEPACFSYSNFLLATTAVEPFEVGLAALLPCFWIYREVGHFIARNESPNNPFQPWIDTYTDDDYDKVVDRMLDITNSAAHATSDANQDKMLQAFMDSARLEYKFWDAAYHLEKWPQ